MTDPHVDDLLVEAIIGIGTICGATSRRRLVPADDFTAREAAKLAQVHGRRPGAG